MKDRANWSKQCPDNVRLALPSARPRDSRGSGARLVPSIGALALLVVMLLAVSTGQAFGGKVRPSKGNFGSAAQPSFADAASLAIDPSSGDLLVADVANRTLSRFKPNGEPDNFPALGTNVIDGASGEDQTPQNGILSTEGLGTAAGEAEVAVAPPGAAAGTGGDIYVTDAYNEFIDVFASSGKYLGQLPRAGYSCGVAVAPNGDVYVGDFTGSLVHKFVPTAPATFTNPANFTANFPGSGPCQVAAGAGPSEGSVFVSGFNGPVTKIIAEGPQEGVTQYTVAEGEHTALSVDPATGDVFTSTSSRVKEYNVDGSTAATEVAPPLNAASAVQGIAVNAGSGDTYISRSSNGHVEIFGPVSTVPVVTTKEASGLQSGGATLHGTVDPEGVQLQECAFEYGLTTKTGFEAAVPCSPTAAEITPDSSVHAVAASLTGLQRNTTYRFRLTVAAEGAKTSGEELEFTTGGPPQITEIRSFNADQTSATVEAKVNPSGYPTRYRIEWGPTTAYGNVIPAKGFEPFVGSGQQLVPVTGELSDLSPGTLYHYRIVAGSGEGRETFSPDQQVETLDSCGLPEHRCFELVSRGDPGPVANPGQIASGTQLTFQAAPTGPGALAYNVEGGYPDSTRGAQVLYVGSRGTGGWSSVQFDPPLTTQNETKGSNSNSDATLTLSGDLSCGLVASRQPLPPDPGNQAVIEAGGSNLYRRNHDGSYTAITTLPPTNPAAASGEVSEEYYPVGMSADCGKAVFSAPYQYSGIPGAGEGRRAYEWTEGGGLKSLITVPAEGGSEKPAEVIEFPNESRQNRVSANGSHVFFIAKRLTGAVPGEKGKQGVFVRESGSITHDLSASQTGTPDSGAEYQDASASGNRVFFTANAGLTEESSIVGTDLYEYNFEKPEGERLTDLSIDNEAGGAGVGGVLGASTDGSHVYFAARGQLLPGQGRTRAQNEAGNTYSVYGETNGTVSYVGTVEAGELLAHVSVMSSSWTSRVSPDGRYLLFETSADVTGYESGGALAKEAYLYDAASGVTTCLSCRRDGRPSLASESRQTFPLNPLAGGEGNPLSPPKSLVLNGGEPKVFFVSRDRLAPGALEGTASLYEWAHGQVLFVARAPEGTLPLIYENAYANAIKFVGASEDGSDAYFVTAGPLNWEDHNERPSVYDARVGGGFPQPAAPPPPCVPASENSCQGAPGSGVATPFPGTSTFQGPGNSKHGAKHHRKKHKKHKRKSKGGKHHKKARNARHAGGNRRAGK